MGSYTYVPVLFKYDDDMIPYVTQDSDGWIEWMKDNKLIEEFHYNTSAVKLFFLGQDPQEHDLPILFEVYYRQNDGLGGTQRFLTYESAKGFFDIVSFQLECEG